MDDKPYGNRIGRHRAVGIVEEYFVVHEAWLANAVGIGGNGRVVGGDVVGTRAAHQAPVTDGRRHHPVPPPYFELFFLSFGVCRGGCGDKRFAE